jgi:hypothetical protein
MLPHEDLALIAALCDKIGLPWEINPRRNKAEFPWNGRSLNLACERNGTSDLCHGIAHWLVSPPARRQHVEFGLSFWSFEDSIEESYASLLGMLIERSLGFYWAYTWDLHCWPESAPKARKEIRELRRRGLLKGLVPTCLL